MKSIARTASALIVLMAMVGVGLARAQTSADVELQKQALFALAQQSDGQAIPYLIDVARTHASPEVRKQAIFWLAQKSGADALEALEQIAAEDPSVEVQKQILFAYSQLPASQGVPLLLQAAREHERAEVRKQAVFWLGQKGGEDVMTFFDELLNSEDGDVATQKQVLFAYSQLPRDEGVPKLIEAARTHPRVAVRKQAVFWLGQSGDERARDALLEIVQGS